MLSQLRVLGQLISAGFGCTAPPLWYCQGRLQQLGSQQAQSGRTQMQDPEEVASVAVTGGTEANWRQTRPFKAWVENQYTVTYSHIHLTKASQSWTQSQGSKVCVFVEATAKLPGKETVKRQITVQSVTATSHWFWWSSTNY